MDDLITKSPIQFEHRPDGTVGLVGRPDVTVRTLEGQAWTERPDWERQLGLPRFEEQWEELSIVQGVSDRQVRFILCDESPTKFVGHYRNQPARIRFAPGRYLFTLGHDLNGAYAIGFCYVLALLPQEGVVRELANMVMDIPDTVEGDCVIGQAVLYRSGLADASWDGLQRGIFSHVCAVVDQTVTDLEGAGDLKEIALTTEAEAGCPGAHVLKTWR